MKGHVIPMLNHHLGPPLWSGIDRHVKPGIAAVCPSLAAEPFPIAWVQYLIPTNGKIIVVYGMALAVYPKIERHHDSTAGLERPWVVACSKTLRNLSIR